MLQVDEQNKCPRWHSVSRRETNISPARQRKKRKRRFKLLNRFRFHPRCRLTDQNLEKVPICLPNMIILSLFVVLLAISIRMSTRSNENGNSIFAQGQLVLDHPKSYRLLDKSQPVYPSSNRGVLSSGAAEDEIHRLLRKFRSPILQPSSTESHIENITLYSAMPSSKDKQNELLRRLSSTMLLETLLRHPIQGKRSPFPPLPLPIRPGHLPNSNSSFSTDRKQTKAENTSTKLAKQQKPSIHVSSSNRTSMTNKENAPDDTKNLKSFNASSLSYLVEKLLSVDSAGKDSAHHLKRPSPRRESSRPSTDSAKTNHNQASNSSAMTLDMLIKDEYDSRLKPMVKSLLQQQNLTAALDHPKGQPNQAIKTNSSRTNHRADGTSPNHEDKFVPNSSKKIPNFQSTTSNLFLNMPTTEAPISSSDRHSDSLSHDEMVAFEDPEYLDEFEDDDSQADEPDESSDDDQHRSKKASSTKHNKLTTTKPPVRKSFLNVPPYQLSGNLDMYLDRHSHHLKTLVPETQATTSSTNNLLTTDASESNAKVKDLKVRERGAVASIRGTLVYSDGDHEAERANRQRGHSNIGSGYTNPYRTRVDSSLDGGSDQSNNSFILNQLFSTVNPLSDFDDKLKEQIDTKHRPDAAIQGHPFYKDYTRKDEYPTQTSSSDWLLRNRSAPSKTTHNPYESFSTTQTPPIDSTPPYGYFHSQPVTNAQSVPSRLIPTSDPLDLASQLPSDFSGQYGMKSVPGTDSPPPFGNYLPTTSQTTTSLSADRTLISNSHNRKYSYQIPEKPNKNQVHTESSHHDLPFINITITPKSQVNQTSDLGEGPKFKNESLPNLDPPSDIERNWSPTKVVQLNNSSQAGQTQNQQVQKSSVTGSPIMVSIVGSKNLKVTSNPKPEPPANKTSMLSPSGNEFLSNASTSTINETSSAPVTEINNRKGPNTEDEVQVLLNSSHANKRANSQRNKLKIPIATPQDSVVLSEADNQPLGDTESDQDFQKMEKVQGTRKTKISKGGQSNRQGKPSKSEIDAIVVDYQNESDEETEESDDHDQPRSKISTRNWPRVRSNNEEVGQEKKLRKDGNAELKHRQVRKKGLSPHITHEPAESEISLTGLDQITRSSDGRKRNQTSRFVHNKQSVRTPSSSVNNAGTHPPSATTSFTSVPTSFGSTIIPNSNFFGEASSESPTLDSSIPVINADANGKVDKNTQFGAEDPYQRVNANNVLATLQQSTPAMIIPTISTKVQTAPAIPETPKNQDESSSTSASGPGLAKTSNNKTTSDRLAFILIGGSCALSVVCLALAAMSIRCQDMCDDYRSLRNAERAALKLQKHRLKYTKNHQINRYNHGQDTSNDIGSTLFNDLNVQNNSSSESGINQTRNPSCLNNNSNNNNASTNAKSIQFDDHVRKNNNSDLNMWNSSNCQLPISAFINKEIQPCSCANCTNQRWLCQDDMILGGKSMSWLHPYYYLQHCTRPKPLFGAGSSVGTFFPRRMNDSACHSGGTADAQFLIDSQPTHSCMVADQKGVTRSKSILQKGKTRQRHSSSLDTPCDMSNFGCSNTECSHHICNNHLGSHRHKCSLEITTRDESEPTLDDSDLSDSAKCSNHHNIAHSSRFKHGQSRPTNGHSNHNVGWKSPSMRKSAQNRHHHQVSSSDTSSIVQCTCSRDQQPLISNNDNRRLKTSHKHLPKHELRSSLKQKAKRDNSILVWSTNRDRLI